MDYPGKVITKTQVTPTQTSASGNWTLDDQAAAIKNNNWPVALVPNPISKSLRFNSADSAYLNRTPATATNRRTFTWSGWVKRGSFSSTQALFESGNGTGIYTLFWFTSSDQIQLLQDNGSGGVLTVTTNAVFRDPSAWYHIVIAFDTTQATSNNRTIIYVNGTNQSLTYTAQLAQNADTWVNFTYQHRLGARTGGTSYFNGYLTEINFIDGQALTPSDFGLTNPQTGQWIPKKYTGTYGTNGFYLNFKDATSTTTLGYDYSGNANNWTTNNFSVTAGSGNDSLTDVPTPWVAYNTTGDVGGVVRGNYCTMNPTIAASLGASSTLLTLTDGNLFVRSTTPSNGIGWGTISVSSGKWYWEFTLTEKVTYDAYLGITLASRTALTYNTPDYCYISNGNKRALSASAVAYGATWGVNDVIGVAFDADAATLTFYKNNSSQGTAFTSIPSGAYVPSIYMDNGNTQIAGAFNFGQRPFAYTPPAGFRSLCTTNLPATAIGFGLTNQGGNYFNAVLWTGDGASSRNITGVGFQPDWVWLKSRSNATVHRIFDSVRGATKTISSNLTDAESTEAQQLTAFISDGFSLGSDVGTNGSARTFVAWNWKASGSTVTNTAGTITSTVSANTTAGFSVVTYTGTGANATVGHGLGVAPSMVIVKNRDTAATNWKVYHIGLTSASYALELDTTGAQASSAAYWNSTAPTSTVFSVGTSLTVNENTKKMVAYCFAAVPGYSAFGSYTGNGSADGPFIYCGFRPRYILRKRTDSTGGWLAQDSSRPGYNATTTYSSVLYPNTSDAELIYNEIDILSNGFKIRATDTFGNASGGTYIYAAFAESPFQFANAR